MLARWLASPCVFISYFFFFLFFIFADFTGNKFHCTCSHWAFSRYCTLILHLFTLSFYQILYMIFHLLMEAIYCFWNPNFWNNLWEDALLMHMYYILAIILHSCGFLCIFMCMLHINYFRILLAYLFVI